MMTSNDQHPPTPSPHITPPPTVIPTQTPTPATLHLPAGRNPPGVSPSPLPTHPLEPHQPQSTTTVDWGIDANSPLVDSLIEDFFLKVKFPVTTSTLLQLNCCTIPSIGMLAYQPMSTTCLSFTKRNLCDEALMNQVTYILCFGHAINIHLLPPKTVPTSTAYHDITTHARDIACTFITAYPAIHQAWQAAVDDHLDNLVGTTIVTHTSRSVRRNRSKGGSRSYRSANSNNITSSHQSFNSIDNSSEVSSLGITSSAAKRAFLPTPEDIQATQDMIREQQAETAPPATPMDLDARHAFYLKTAQRASLLSPSKYEKRPPLPARIIWSGNLGEFEYFRDKVEGHYAQIGAGYLFDEDIQQKFLEKGFEAILDFPDEGISTIQFKKDVGALYGALRSACQSGVGKTILFEHRAKQDGVRAWIALKHKYDADGNKDLQIKRLENIIGTKFYRRYKGGLLQWVQDYENAFAELVHLGEEAWIKDSSRKRRILQNADDTGLNPTIMQSLTKSETFEEVCNMLRTHAINQEERDRENAARKVHNTQTCQSIMEAFHNLSTNENSEVSSFANLIGQMPVDLWAQLPKEARYWLMQERKRLKQEYVPKPDSQKTSSEQDHTQTDKLPRQYGNGKKTETKNVTAKVQAFLAQHHQVDDMTDDSDDSDDSDDDALISLANNVKTSIAHVGICKKRADRAICMLGLSNHKFLSLADSGADTTILGKGWAIIAVHPNRRAHVFVFDNEAAQKRNLHIGTGV